MKRIFTSLINRGMTLIELLVSIAIFTIITSVVLFNHTEFNSNVLVTNLAYEVALAIRQAQTYGLSVKRGVNYPFGIYMDTNGLSSIIIFGDKDKNNFFGDGTGVQYSGPCTGEHIEGDPNDPNNQYDTCEEKLTLRGNVSISEFCVGERCVSSNAINWASILFKRPNPVAIIKGEKFETPDNSDNSYFTITLKSKSTDKEKTVKVERTGQISVVQE